MPKFIKFFSLGSVLLITAGSCPLSFEKLAEENMKSFAHDISPLDEPHFDTYSPYLEWLFNKQVNLKVSKKRETTFALLRELEKESKDKQDSEVLDFTTVQDLNLISGPKSDPATYLASKINVSTEMAKILLMKKITEPKVNVSELKHYQDMIKEIINNKDLFNELNNLCETLKQSESLMLSLWQLDAIRHAVLRKKIHLPIGESFAKFLNENSYVMEMTERLSELQDCMVAGVQTAGAVLVPAHGVATLFNNNRAQQINQIARDRFGVTPVAGFFSMLGVSTWLIKQIISNRFTETANDGASGWTYGTGAYYAFDNIKANFFLLQSLQTKFMHLARHIDAFYRLEKIVQNNGLLKNYSPIVQPLEQVLHTLPQEDSDFRSLLDHLQSNTFKGESSVLSRVGKILAVSNLLDNHKNKLVKGLIALGEIDLLVSIAKLCKASEGRKATWCFPEYIENATSPSAFIEDCWNPFIDPEKVVTNSVSIGCNGNPQTLIITGPNAGGKSTVMKAVIESFIFGQSLGIAPAKYCEFTPYSKIITYLNITDDIAAGKSHFKAGALRAHEVILAMKSLADKQYGFIGLDEVFNGTTYIEGEAAAFTLVEMIGYNPNICCMTAIHFPMITELEQKTKGRYFKNHKVSVNYDQNGRLVYPYKLEPGIANQAIALDVLSDEGYSSEFLERARSLVAAKRGATGNQKYNADYLRNMCLPRESPAALNNTCSIEN